MNSRRWIVATALCLALAPPAFATCKIGTIAEIPVSVVHNRVLVDAKINGQDAKVMVDTGAAWTFLWENEAARLGLPIETGTRVRSFGIGGEAKALGTMVAQFQMGSFSGDHLHLEVIGTKGEGQRNGAALVLGDDFFSNFTTEFDLAHDVIRLLRPEGCQPDQLTYWSDTYSLAELDHLKYEHPRIRTNVVLNGKRFSAFFDTGAPVSLLTRHAAESVGVTPGQAGTVAAPAIAGIAMNPIDSWNGTFATFSIGDESMRNVKLRVADLFAADTIKNTGSLVRQPAVDWGDMVVGCDFFLSHRILVLPKEHTLLFTYNGGPVFQHVRSGAPPKEDLGPKPGAPAAAPPARTP